MATHSLGSRPLRALLFDVDGTLYRSAIVRRAMARRLAWFGVRDLREGAVTVRILRAYRRAQETLRHDGRPAHDLAHLQASLASERVGCGVDRVRDTVGRWMEREPIDLLRRARRPGVASLLTAARQRGLRLAVVSDYPAMAKLKALEIAHLFDVVVAAQDRDVQRFKPHPRGLLAALERLGVGPEEALYVGDRPDVDAAAAAGAGVRCVITGGRRAWGHTAPFERLSCEALAHFIADNES